MSPHELKRLLEARFGSCWVEGAAGHFHLNPGAIRRWVAGTRRPSRRNLVLLRHLAETGDGAVEAEIRHRHERLDGELKRRIGALRETGLCSKVALIRRDRQSNRPRQD